MGLCRVLRLVERAEAEHALANFNWLGRHSPEIRDTTLGHQLLLPLGRVVSTKVYLSSRGRDESVRQHAATWRQKFLQQGMQGTAIVFGNGNVSEAMNSFPPEDDVLRDTFVAVFTASEKPTAQEQEVMQGCSEDAVRKQTAMAQTALRKEVELEVDKMLFDKQARRLIDTNYV